MDLIAKLFRSKTGQQSLITTSANFFSAAIMAVAMIVLGRVLGPEQFGVFSVSISLMLILNQVINVGFNQLIARFVGHWYQRPKKQQAFLAHVLYWQILLTFFLLLIGIFGTGVFARVANYPYPMMIALSIAGAIFFALYNYLYFVFVAKQQFTKAGLMNITQAVIKALAFAVIICLYQSNLLAITSSYYLALLLAALIFLIISKDKLLFKPKLLTGSLAKKVNSFWWHSAISSLSIVLIDNLDLLLVQQRLNEYQAGLYSGAMKITMFLSLVGLSLETVLNSRVARYQQKKVIKDFLKKSRIVIVLSMLLSVILVPASQTLIKYTLGIEFLEATSILRLLMINSFLTILVLPLTAVFYAIERPKYFSTVALMRILIIFVLGWWWLPLLGARAVAISKIIATMVVLCYSWVMVKKELK